jgi:hypothetical protein
MKELVLGLVLCRTLPAAWEAYKDGIVVCVSVFVYTRLCICFDEHTNIDRRLKAASKVGG